SALSRILGYSTYTCAAETRSSICCLETSAAACTRALWRAAKGGWRYVQHLERPSTSQAQQKFKESFMMKSSHQNRERADLAQTSELADQQRAASTASRNGDGLEVLETREWLDSLDYVLAKGGPERAGRLLQQLQLHARRAAGVNLPFVATTPYQNTIPVRQQAPFPGSQEMERRIKSLVRWNAMAMVVRANRVESG